MLLNLREHSATSVSDGGVPTRTVAAHNGKAIASLFLVSHPQLDRPGLLPDTRFSMDGLGLAVVKVERRRPCRPPDRSSRGRDRRLVVVVTR